MSDTPTRGDATSRAPNLKTGGWLNDLARKRGPRPFFPGHGLPAAGPSTTAVHAGTHNDPRTGTVGTPNYQASTFLLNADHYGSLETGVARDRFIYSRYGNPSQWAVQEKLAAQEGADSAIVFSSGMAAITATVTALVDRGAHVVVHLTSKYLNGHSDLIAGVACGTRKLIDMIWPRHLNLGGSLDPHACIMLERGRNTLAIRMRAHAESAHTPVGCPEFRYTLHAVSDATPEELAALRARAVSQSPNAQTILHPVALTGELVATRSAA